MVAVLEDNSLALQFLNQNPSTQLLLVLEVLAVLVQPQHLHQQLKMAVFHLFLE